MTVANSQQGCSEDVSAVLRRVYDEHGQSVARHLRMRGVPQSDLDDALQEVFIVVFRGMEDYRERGRMRAWLYSVSTRVAWTRTRSLRRRREDLVDHHDLVAGPTQHERIVDREALALGKQLLHGLPQEQRDIFWLYEVDELSMPAIARLVNCPLQTAYSRLRQARKRLVRAMGHATSRDRART